MTESYTASTSETTEMPSFSLAGLAMRPVIIQYAETGGTEQSLRADFMEIMERATKPGLAALDMTLEDLGSETAEALQVMYPRNLLLRPRRDYATPGRVQDYPPVSPRLGGVYTPQTASTLETATFITDAQASVDLWFDFLAGKKLGTGGHHIPGTDADWTEIAKQLRRPVDSLFTGFARHVNRSATADGEKLTAEELLDRTQLGQAMLPYALAIIAARANASSTDGFNNTFSQDMTAKIAEAYDKRQSTRPKTAPTAQARAYDAAVTRFADIFTSFGLDGNSDFHKLFITHAFGTYLAELQSGQFVTGGPREIIERALQSTAAACTDFGMEATDDLQTRFKERMAVALSGSTDLFRSKADTFVRSLNQARSDFLIKIQCVAQSQALLDYISDESFSPDRFNDVIELATERPLVAWEERVGEIKALYEEWEIAPSEKGLHGPRGGDVAPNDESKRPGSSEGTDEEREEWLKEYIRQWGAGVIVRSKLPDLPKREQYQIALLPVLLPNGEMTWHGIADNKWKPERQKHALLLFRAESGIDRYGRVRVRWDQVFRHYKRVMREAMGVKPLKHTPTLRSRLEAELARQPNQVPGYEAYHVGRLATGVTTEIAESDAAR